MIIPWYELRHDLDRIENDLWALEMTLKSGTMDSTNAWMTSDRLIGIASRCTAIAAGIATGSISQTTPDTGCAQSQSESPSPGSFAKAS